MRPELPTGTVTFLFTDIEGSTRLLHALGPDALRARRSRSTVGLLREAFAADGGVEVDTQGDAFFVAFPTAPAPHGAARTRARRTRRGPGAGPHRPPHGRPDVTEEGYVGADVHRGARIAALAHGGQTIVSPTTAALLDGDELLDLGVPSAEGLRRRRFACTSTARHFPPLRTPGSVQLPTPATTFLGRETELLDAVAVVLERDPRVLTSSARAVPARRGSRSSSRGCSRRRPTVGRCSSRSHPLTDADLIIAAVAQALGAATPSAEAIAARVDARRTHVLLDNLEHLLPAAAPRRRVARSRRRPSCACW